MEGINRLSLSIRIEYETPYGRKGYSTVLSKESIRNREILRKRLKRHKISIDDVVMLKINEKIYNPKLLQKIG